jgi:hypothetical protein
MGKYPKNFPTPFTLDSVIIAEMIKSGKVEEHAAKVSLPALEFDVSLSSQDSLLLPFVESDPGVAGCCLRDLKDSFCRSCLYFHQLKCRIVKFRVILTSFRFSCVTRQICSNCICLFHNFCYTVSLLRQKDESDILKESRGN